MYRSKDVQMAGRMNGGIYWKEWTKGRKRKEENNTKGRKKEIHEERNVEWKAHKKKKFGRNVQRKMKRKKNRWNKRKQDGKKEMTKAGKKEMQKGRKKKKVEIQKVRMKDGKK